MTRNSDRPRTSGKHPSGQRRAVRIAPPSILLVDDHPPNLMALEAILEPTGARLLRASSGAEAVQIAAKEDLAIALLDLQMPELDGLETAALIKKTERGRSVPIMILTAREPTRAEVARGYASGAVDFLFKPLDPDVLRSKVTVFLGLHTRPSSEPAPSEERMRSEEPSGRISERLLASAAETDPEKTVEALVRLHSAEELATLATEQAALYEEAQEARHHAELAELELRADEARLRLALEAGGLGTWEFNPVTGALRWDARTRTLFGVSQHGEMNYGRFLAAVHAGDRDRVDRAVQRALDPLGGGTFELEHRTTENERWLAVKGQAIVEHGRTLRLLGVVQDVTAKKRVEEERAALLASAERAREEAESASRAKDEFLATVSHELRNPLNAILGWSRVLVEEEIDPDRARKGLEVIARNAKTQVQLVEDILEVSRIVTGKLRLTTGPVDVRANVDAAVETVRSAAQAKGVVLEALYESDPGLIVADEDRLQQVLWNLLSNAVKLTPYGGRVRVVARREDEAVVIFVEDSGEGIDAEFLPYVFDRFRQADGSTTRTHGGLGLGLAIVRHLVELHGGTVTAASGGKGTGATFTVTLPLRAHAKAGALEARAPLMKRPQAVRGDAMPMAKRRVVVLDDEEDMRDLIAMILEHAGAEVVRVSSVAAAMREIENDPPDVAVSDLAMPGEDGYAFVRRVRSASRPDVAGIPLVAMTAYARAEDRHRVLAAGFDRHVPKPIEPAELVTALCDVVARSGR